MGPGDILKLGAIIIPLVMFLAFVGVKVVENAKEAGRSMQSEADNLATTSGSTW